jgi:MFS family permease
MIVGALGSALSPSFRVLIVFRFVLGFGGDYPVSAVMMSEYANRKDRGKLVGMVFGTQAPGPPQPRGVTYGTGLPGLRGDATSCWRARPVCPA